MPYHVVEQAMELLNEKGKPLNGARVLLLGMAYKKDIDDLRESPALKIAKLLLQHGADISYHDPFVPHCQVGKREVASIDLTEEALSQTDLVIIITAHTNVDYKMVAEHAPLILDTRNATKGIKSPNIVRLGVGR
jgi:UDP-N-acetyl-D-glucosamine dehydrogenase